MPKIRQAIAVFALATFCIGFNTYRYPVVRQMVSAASPPAPSAELKPAEKTRAADTSQEDAGPADAAAPKHPAGVVCKDGVCRMASPESPSASLNFSAADEAASPGSDAEKKPEGTSESPKEAEPTEKPSSESPSEEKAEEKAEETQQKSTTEDQADSNGSSGETTSADRSSPFGEESHRESADGKTAAKLVSSPATVDAPPSGMDQQRTEQVALIPIQRPRSHAKDTGDAADKPASDPKPQAMQEPEAHGLRRLPPVDSSAGADLPMLTPEIVSTYPVTAAK